MNHISLYRKRKWSESHLLEKWKRGITLQLHSILIGKGDSHMIVSTKMKTYKFLQSRTCYVFFLRNQTRKHKFSRTEFCHVTCLLHLLNAYTMNYLKEIKYSINSIGGQKVWSQTIRSKIALLILVLILNKRYW